MKKKEIVKQSVEEDTPSWIRRLNTEGYVIGSYDLGFDAYVFRYNLEVYELRDGEYEELERKMLVDTRRSPQGNNFEVATKDAFFTVVKRAA